MKTVFSVIVLAAALLRPAAAQLPPVDQRAVCLECHGDLAQTLTQPHVHAPLAQGKCSECHNPHAASHQALLVDDETALCTRCHAQAAGWSAERHVHAPVQSGHCTACHNPHASKQAKLLSGALKTVCAECHPGVNDWFTKANVHYPVKQGRCDRCHVPHASGQDGLLKAAQSTLCMECHRATPAFVSSHKGFDPAQSRCSACHDPHASSSRTLLMANLHSPFADNSCNACHVPGEGTGYPLKGNSFQVCGACHQQETAQVRQHAAHGATEEQACGMCHNPHASHEKNLLAASQRRLCFRCHDPAQGRQPLQPTIHAGLTCVSCHAVHGSERPHYLRDESIAMCGRCHSHQHHVAHPMGERATDPRTGGPVDCISCHRIHGSEYDMLMIADAERDLCIRCHTNK